MPIQKESHTTELKKSLAQLDVALKSVCAFLNHKGGTVYFGVANDGKITGLNVTDKTLRKISQQIHSRIKPEITPEIREVKEKGESIIELKIPKGNNKPYFLNGVAYKRIGTE
ncbi:MAG: ATP-binding protein, partial [Methanophagales archaeon]|nr:ATP-binding protein [Methanophagales archaeon]